MTVDINRPDEDTMWKLLKENPGNAVGCYSASVVASGNDQRRNLLADLGRYLHREKNNCIERPGNPSE